MANQNFNLPPPPNPNTDITDYSWKDWLNNPLIKILLGSLLFIIILYGLKFLLNSIKPVKGTSNIILGGGHTRENLSIYNR